MYLPRSLISQLYSSLLKTHQPLSPPVLILPALETDAICACRILTALLKRDYIPHKIQPVSGYTDLTKAGEELVRPMKINEGGSGGVVICLGVGGLVDLSHFLGLDDDAEEESSGSGVEVWVFDARRPWNLDNVFGGWVTNAATTEDNAVTFQKIPGVDKGCIQKSYRPGRGGVIVFDDGDIADELASERNAYCALLEMPQVPDEDNVNDDDEDDDDMEEDSLSSPSSRKRKSLSSRDRDEYDSDDDRPRQRMRSNSGSSITTRSQRTPSSSQSLSPPRQHTPDPFRQPSAKQLRKKLRNLRRKHSEVLEDYNELGQSYSEPVSSLIYSLASELGREDNDLLWLAIVGVTSLEISGHTSTGLGTPQARQEMVSKTYHQGWRTDRSARTYALLRDEVRRLNPAHSNLDSSFTTLTSTSSASDSSILLVPDPRFMLLRHWSLYDSMLHSPYLAARLHVWNDNGVKRLHKLLAKMGISLNQCRQGYIHMDANVRSDLRERLLKYASQYGLDELVPGGNGQGLKGQEGWGFVRNWGWKAQLSAVDVGVIIDAILETVGSSVSSAGALSSTQSTDTEAVAARSEALIPKFFAAYDALAPNHPNKLLTSIPKAQQLLRSIHRTGSSLLAKNQVRNLRTYRLGVLKDGPDLGLFANSPGALVKLALWVGEAKAISEMDKKGGGKNTPLILAALDESRNSYLVVGVGDGIGSAEDAEIRKEKAEAKAKRVLEKKQRKEQKEKDRQARRAARELLDDLDEDEDSEEEEDDASEDEADDIEDDKDQKRGYGRSKFGQAFQQVIEETSTHMELDSFDHCVVEVQKADLSGFLESLSQKSIVAR